MRSLLTFCLHLSIAPSTFSFPFLRNTCSQHLCIPSTPVFYLLHPSYLPFAFLSLFHIHLLHAARFHLTCPLPFHFLCTPESHLPDLLSIPYHIHILSTPVSHLSIIPSTIYTFFAHLFHTCANLTLALNIITCLGDLYRIYTNSPTLVPSLPHSSSTYFVPIPPASISSVA